MIACFAKHRLHIKIKSPPLGLLLAASKVGDADLVKVLLAAGADKEERDGVSFIRRIMGGWQLYVRSPE